ncbi:hypothetical protein [Nibricoccus aquaticus]|uniref:hypothetical protein n=1 Tax=Nibricoccus aquaticus TaxID=2576891 RepID=UPI0010FF1401|nr:hypothetical protein [Nibricoccus aquaticus]
MNLLFVCTSLEPGRDGVGDYTRLLASACADAGHTCALLAINDGHLKDSTPVVQETQFERGHTFPVLRLSPDKPWTARYEHAQSFVATHAPEWVSWQIVPYGFHPKGIIPDSAFEFARLGEGRLNHLMLHELWIGLSLGEPLKNRVYGFLQRRALMAFIQCLAPALIDTSNPAYRSVLVHEGCTPGVLPLCGNIPIEPMPPVPRGDEWVGGIFGTVHTQLDPRPCISALARGAKASKRTLRILGFGRLGAYGDKLFAQLKDEYSHRSIVIENLGERPQAEVSRLLQSLDFGIGTHPWALIGKSGAVSAMLDHGIPVIVPRDDWSLRRPPTPPPLRDSLIVRLSDTPSELMAGWLSRRRPPQSRLPALAAAFLSRLNRVADPAPHPQ